MISLRGSHPRAYGARTSTTLLLACIAAIWFQPATSRAADPFAFASASGSCEKEESVWATAPVAANHSDVIARYQTSAGPVTFTGYPGGSAVSEGYIVGPDTLWVGWPSISAGETISGKVYCDREHPTGPYSVVLYDVPTAPTAFSGASSFGTEANDVLFDAPGEAQYVADLSLSGGSVALKSETRSQTFASSGEFELGTLTKGDNHLQLEAEEGPQAVWSIQIRVLPVALSGVTFDQQAVEPGKIVHLAYTTSGETSVTAVLHNASGQVVRTLVTGLAVDRGNHTLTWDGRDQIGNLMPDGSYTADVTTVDPSGERQSASAMTQLDSGPETIFTRKPPKLSRHREVKFAFRASTPGARFQCEYTSGWRGCMSPRVFHLAPGKYRFAVRAIDRFGIVDRRPAVWRFRIRRR